MIRYRYDRIDKSIISINSTGDDQLQLRRIWAGV